MAQTKRVEHRLAPPAAPGATAQTPAASASRHATVLYPTYAKSLADAQAGQDYI